MHVFKREAVALTVITFYFLVLKQQTRDSRFKWLLLLQHLKKSWKKGLTLLQIALQKTGHFITMINLRTPGDI